MELTKTIPPPTVGGKDMRTNKQKAQDNRTLPYDVAQKTMFEEALERDRKMKADVEQLQQDQRTLNRTKLNENS